MQCVFPNLWQFIIYCHSTIRSYIISASDTVTVYMCSKQYVCLSVTVCQLVMKANVCK